MTVGRKKLGLVLGTVPNTDEIDQFKLLVDKYEVHVISSQSICDFIQENSSFHDLTCMALPDHESNPSYIPGLEKVLRPYDIVITKGRLGLYSYQALKAKWRYQHKLYVWVDNLQVLPANDIEEMKTIRLEVTSGADGFIVQTPEARKVLELEGVSTEDIFDIPVWVESKIARTKETKADLRQQMGFSESDFVITYFGQIEWEEGLSDLASACRLAIKANPSLQDKLRVVFSGIGSYAEELQGQFNLNGCADLVGYILPTRASHKALLAVTDLMYISPLLGRDRIEGEPFRYVTAMQHKIPVIAARNPVSEFYLGKHRLDFCVGSPLSLSKAILKAFTSSSLMKDMTEKNFAKLGTTEKAEEQLLQVIDTLVSRDGKKAEFVIARTIRSIEGLVKKAQYLQAIDLIEELFKSSSLPVHHKSNLYRIVGDCFAKLGDVDAAKQAYVQSLDLDGYSAKAHVGLGTVGLLNQSFDIAVLHFQKAIGLSPDDEMANLGLGLAFEGMEEYSESMKWVRQALILNPGNPAALYSLVKASYVLEKYDDVEKFLRIYLSSNPKDTNIRYTLAGVLFKKEMLEDAQTELDLILQLDSENEKANELSAKILEVKSKAKSSNG